MTDPRVAAFLADYLPKVPPVKPSRFRGVSSVLMALYVLLVTIGLYRVMDRVDVLEKKVSGLRNASLDAPLRTSALPDVITDPPPDAFGPVLKVMPRRRLPLPRVDPADCEWLDLRQEGNAIL